MGGLRLFSRERAPKVRRFVLQSAKFQIDGLGRCRFLLLKRGTPWALDSLRGDTCHLGSTVPPGPTYRPSPFRSCNEDSISREQPGPAITRLEWRTSPKQADPIGPSPGTFQRPFQV